MTVDILMGKSWNVEPDKRANKETNTDVNKSENETDQSSEFLIHMCALKHFFNNALFIHFYKLYVYNKANFK